MLGFAAQLDGRDVGDGELHRVDARCRARAAAAQSTRRPQQQEPLRRFGVSP